MRRTVFLTTALLTFVLGTTLVSLERQLLNTLNEPPPAEASVPTADIRESVTPLRIGIFIGVDGVTLSADGKKFGFYEDYDDREILIPVSPTELSDIVGNLRSAGLFEEAEFNSPFFVSLPQTFTIVIGWPDKDRRFTWITRDECRVPEKYLEILQKFNRRFKSTLIQDFVSYSHRNVSSENPPLGCFH